MKVPQDVYKYVIFDLMSIHLHSVLPFAILRSEQVIYKSA